MLRIQQKIYGLGSACDHADIAATLGQLGELERVRKDFNPAAQYFAQQEAMLRRLLAACGVTSGTAIAVDSAEEANFIEPLLRQLIGPLPPPLLCSSIC